MKLEIVKGESKKTGKEYRALKVSIGDWSTLVFPRSRFEMDYIENYLREHNK